METTIQTKRTLALSVLAGLIAGGILAALDVALVIPAMNLLTDEVIDQLVAGGEFDEDFDARTSSIYVASTVGAVGLGIGAGALFGSARIISQRAPSFADSMLLAAVAWLVLYAVPSAKYPPSLAALYDQSSADQYYPLYFGYVAVSGLSALVIFLAFRKVRAKNKLFGIAAAYFVVVAVSHFAFPTADVDSAFTQSMLNHWRTMVSVSTAAFWFSAGALAFLLCRARR